jgi:hypothetical protein
MYSDARDGLSVPINHKHRGSTVLLARTTVSRSVLLSSDCAKDQVKFRKVVVRRELQRGGQLHVCGPCMLHAIKHIQCHLHNSRFISSFYNLYRQLRTRTSPNACCLPFGPESFIFPLANEKYKDLKYRITILHAVLHG